MIKKTKEIHIRVNTDAKARESTTEMIDYILIEMISEMIKHIIMTNLKKIMVITKGK